MRQLARRGWRCSPSTSSCAASRSDGASSRAPFPCRTSYVAPFASIAQHSTPLLRSASSSLSSRLHLAVRHLAHHRRGPSVLVRQPSSIPGERAARAVSTRASAHRSVSADPARGGGQHRRGSGGAGESRRRRKDERAVDGEEHAKTINDLLRTEKTTSTMAPVVAEPLPSQSEALRSVVRLEVAAAEPDWSLPWQKGDPYYTSGSACVIESPPGKLRILTAAHVVANNTFVRAQRQDTARYFSASVVAINHDCDLALLDVNNPKFFAGLKPLEFVDTPTLQNTVVVFGYPEGGESLCATRGVVSRLELQQYQIIRSFKDEGLKLLTLQIDAAINPGNSGGPVLNQDNKIVGVVFQKMGGIWTESVGYVIPTEIIRHFLTDVENGRQPQFCSAGFEYQKADNESLRKWANVKKGQSGIMVTRVDELSSAKGLIQPGDIIMKVEGVDIGNDGTVSLSESKDKENLRLSFEYFVTKKYVGEKLTFTLLRNGEERTVEVTAEPRKYLIPVHEEQRGVTVPNYFIHAGLVFVSLNEHHVNLMDSSPIIGRYYYQNTKRFEDEQVVVLTKILQDQVNAGFSQEQALQLLSLNGKDIRNLRHLIDEVEGCREPFLDFLFDSGERIVLARDQAKRATERILKKYGIRSAKSTNLSKSKERKTSSSTSARKGKTQSTSSTRRKQTRRGEAKEEELSR